jgi:uncharacterized membrane protein YcaP (DUF421 family)
LGQRGASRIRARCDDPPTKTTTLTSAGYLTGDQRFFTIDKTHGTDGERMFMADTVHRFFLGQGDWASLGEIAVRAMLLFMLIMCSMRLLGRRVASQYTLFELSVVVTLAGAVGVPLQATNRGLLPPLFIMMTVIIFEYAMATWSLRYPTFETAISGVVSIIVQRGEIQLDELRRAALSRERLFSMLRKHQVQHLGQLSKVYLEPSGDISLLFAESPCAGLSILPEIDTQLREAVAVATHVSCASCGRTELDANQQRAACVNCGATSWIPASRELDD